MRHISRAIPLSLFAAIGAAATACGTSADQALDETSLYALVQGIDGVYFYPPLGPEPAPTGTFEGTLLDGISVAIQAEDAAGGVTPLATFDQTTQPAVALLGANERYWVNIPAATYVTDPSKTYRIRVLLDGAELGSSVLSARIFTVLSYNPALPIGVHVRIEGSGAVRAASRTRFHGNTGTPRHCSDGIRNKDETGVDCGGGCAPCCVPTPEVCDGADNDCDGQIDEGNPGGGSACNTGLSGACATGVTACTNGAITCERTCSYDCETNHGGCDVNATCEDTVGGHTCTCNAGYSGDGTTCTAYVAVTFAASTNNVNIAAAAGSPTTPKLILVTVNAGVTIGSGSTASAAMTTGNLPAGSTIRLMNYGTIIGAGGAGGRGGGCCVGNGSSTAGGDGGPALEVSAPITIANGGNIFGGGGGGGGGGVATIVNVLASGGGGGGGAGQSAGGGGSPGVSWSGASYPSGASGQSGSATAGGLGGAGGRSGYYPNQFGGSVGVGGTGGAGGGPGQAGGAGANGNLGGAGAPGGQGGQATRTVAHLQLLGITPKSLVTWESGLDDEHVRGSLE